jgi:hypothetical protein
VIILRSFPIPLDKSSIKDLYALHKHNSGYKYETGHTKGIEFCNNLLMMMMMMIATTRGTWVAQSV